MKKPLFDENGAEVGVYYEELGDVYAEADAACQEKLGCSFNEAYWRMFRGEFLGDPFRTKLHQWRALADSIRAGHAAYVFNHPT